MYITLKSTKRNLGLFNLEVEDLIVGGILALIVMFLFITNHFTSAIVLVAITIMALLPVDFSKCNRMYKLFILFFRFVFSNKDYYFYKD